MVRPACFGFNEETASSNAFQSNDQTFTQEEIRTQAIREFNGFVARLREQGVEVCVMEDNPDIVKPDAVFPNNWVTFHADGTVVTYPMHAPVRRKERQEEYLRRLSEKFAMHRHIHLEGYESKNIYLEGTGSLILDRPNKLAYACLSPRTHKDVLDDFCGQLGYTPVLFHSLDSQGQDIYHTNVMMALGETFAVICLDSIPDPSERTMVVQQLTYTGKEIVEISLQQVYSFAGNMLQVRNQGGQTILVMSKQARESLLPEQVSVLEKHTQLLDVDITTIERYGGGSARCMMAEIFLELK